MDCHYTIVNTEKFLDHVRHMKGEGFSDKEIAASMGMKVSEFRLSRTNCLREQRGLEPFPPSYKGSLDKKEGKSK